MCPQSSTQILSASFYKNSNYELGCQMDFWTWLSLVWDFSFSDETVLMLSNLFFKSSYVATKFAGMQNGDIYTSQCSTIVSSVPLPSVMTVHTTHLITSDVTALSLLLYSKLKRWAEQPRWTTAPKHSVSVAGRWAGTKSFWLLGWHLVNAQLHVQEGWREGERGARDIDR